MQPRPPVASGRSSHHISASPFTRRAEVVICFAVEEGESIQDHPNPTLNPDGWAPPLAILQGKKGWAAGTKKPTIQPFTGHFWPFSTYFIWKRVSIAMP